MCLTWAKKDWEFVPVTGDQWKEMKGTLECPGLPQVEMNGKMYGQSLATLRAIG